MASSIKKQVISLFIGKFMSMLILILLPVVLVRLMEKLDYGLYQQGILIINSVGAIFAFGISSSFYYFFNIINIKEKKQLIWQSGFLLLILAIISSFILIFFNEYLSLIVSNVEILQLVLPIGLSVFFFILSDPIEHLLIVEKKSKAVILLLIIQSVIKASLIIFAFTKFDSIAVVFWFISFFYALKSAFYLFYISQNYRIIDVFINWDNSFLFRQLKFTYPIGLGNIVGVIGEKIDKFILSANFNSSDFAMYSVAQFRLPIISLIFPAVSNVLGPQIAVCGKEGDLIKAKIYWHKIIEKFSLVVIPFVMYSIFSARELITLLYTIKYIEAAYLYQIFLFTFFIQMLSRGIILHSFGYTKYIFKVKIIVFICSILLSFLLIPSYGIYGATFSYVFVFYLSGIIQVGKTKAILNLKLRELLPFSYIIKVTVISLLSLTVVIPFKFFRINDFLFLSLTFVLFFTSIIFLFLHKGLIKKEKITTIIEKVKIW